MKYLTLVPKCFILLSPELFWENLWKVTDDSLQSLCIGPCSQSPSLATLGKCLSPYLFVKVFWNQNLLLFCSLQWPCNNSYEYQGSLKLVFSDHYLGWSSSTINLLFLTTLSFLLRLIISIFDIGILSFWQHILCKMLWLLRRAYGH
jgi:hypothetical protein